MNLSLSTSTSTLMWHVLLEILEQGQVAAWVAEFPECRVVAESQAAAISALEVLLQQRMARLQVLPLQVSLGDAENPWLRLCGILKEDAGFNKWSDRFWTEKQQNSEEDELLSVEESLRVM